MQDPKAILFDLYDTLAYADSRLYQRKVEVCAMICSVTSEAFSGAWKSLVVESNLGKFPRTEDRVVAVLRILGVPRNQETIDSITKIEHDFLRSGIFLFDDAIGVLESLRKLGLKLALVTNASPSVQIVLSKYRIEEHMDCIVVSSNIGYRKPHERIYTTALQLMEAKGQDCFFVGDGNDGELDGAHELGITTIWVNRSILSKYVRMKDSSISCVDFTVKSLREVADIIKSHRTEHA